MANLSSAWGTYTFDFSNTALSREQQMQWLKALSDLLLYGEVVEEGQPEPLMVTYFTELWLTQDQTSDIKRFSFAGTGRWAYQNNLQWFITDRDLESMLLQANGLVMTVDFQDLTEDQYIRGNCTFVVMDGMIAYTSDESVQWENIYPKRYLELGIGDKEDAVSHFIDIGELTDEQIDQICEMDQEEFDRWEDIIYEQA